MDYEACRALSRVQIRMIANFVREMLKIKTIKFPVLKALRMLEDKFPNNLYCNILSDDNFETFEMARLVSEGNDVYCIEVRESVYSKAVYGDGASLGFICHEICHFILIYIFGIGPVVYMNSKGIAYTRTIFDNSLPRYLSMEWQTKALCGEIMIPYDRCKDKTIKSIIRYTNSSYEQALYFINVVKKN